MILIYEMKIITLIWPVAMVIAAAEVKLVITGYDIKSTKKPINNKI